jgi:hypothetical protein
MTMTQAGKVLEREILRRRAREQSPDNRQETEGNSE